MKSPAQLPRHVAVIMDGNGRWAQRRGLPRIEGHRRGARSVKEVVRAAEGAAGTAAAVLPPEQCLKILKSVIKTGESPMNIAAIKMLTKVRYDFI